eukprot:SAG31_NODE_2337_length_5921_cov_4.269323_2_plen_63_part_00
MWSDQAHHMHPRKHGDNFVEVTALVRTKTCIEVCFHSFELLGLLHELRMHFFELSIQHRTKS